MNTDQLLIGGFLDRALDLYADREIVSRRTTGVSRTTIAAFASRVEQLSWALCELGVGRGDRVATLAWNDLRHLELYMAVPRCGAVLHTVNLRMSPEQVREVLAHADSRVLFVDPTAVDLALAAMEGGTKVEHVVVLGASPSAVPASWIDYEALVGRQPVEARGVPAGLRETSPAATSYSSATTGRPKGVVYSHRALYLHSAMLAMADTWAISHTDVVLPVVPMFHVNAWGIPFTSIWMGAKIVLPGARPTATDLVRLLAEEGVTVAAAVPTVWGDVFDLIEAEDVALPHLRLLVSGGGPLPAALLDRADRLGLPLVHAYGMTEASPLVLVNRDRVGASDLPADVRRRRLRQGLLVPGLSMRLRSDDGGDVPWDGQSPGQLELRGPWIAEEYERDERSGSAFVDGWYRTGDIATVDPHGYVLLVDRAQDLIKSGGEWISTIQLESELSQHEAIARVAVVGVADDRWQERPVAFVEVATSDSLDPAAIRTWLAERVPRWWVPERIEVLSEMPLTAVGKLDKRSLRERLRDRTSDDMLSDDTQR